MFNRSKTILQKQFSFVHITDTHLEPYNFTKGRTYNIFFSHDIPKILSSEPAFIIDTGDIILGSKKGAVKYKKILDKIPVPVFSVPGNHDRSEFKKINPLYYSFNWGNFHFVGLNQEINSIMGEQLTWLRQDLRNQPKNKPIIIFTHFISDEKNSKFWNLLSSYNVKLILCGHLHYNRIKRYNKIPVLYSGPLSGNFWIMNDYLGFPRGYREIIIKDNKIKSTAYKSLDLDNPLNILWPLNWMVVENSEYPYHPDIASEATRIRAAFLDFGYTDIKKIEYKINRGKWQLMKREGDNFISQRWAGDSILFELKRSKSKLHSVLVRAKDNKRRIWTKKSFFYTDLDAISTHNLISDSFFEDVKQDSFSKRWWVNKKSVVLDKTVFHTSAYSFKINNFDKTIGETLIKMVKPLSLDETKVYNFSVWVKAEGITDTIKCLIMADRLMLALVKIPSGTYNWKRINRQIWARPGSNLDFRIYNGSEGFLSQEKTYGIIWIDGIELKVSGGKF